MEIQDYISALEKVKEMNKQLGYTLSTMNTQISDALSILLGAFKAELNKVKKMLKTLVQTITQTTMRSVRKKDNN